jgi:hypothetical protein
MTFNKIQSRQIDFKDFQTNNRLGIFLIDVKNSNNKNTIMINRYDAIGLIDPIISFGTTETNVDLTFEWEGISTIWDGIVSVNKVIINHNNPNAIFEAIPHSRRFRCELKNFSLENIQKITLEVLNENLVSLSESTVDLLDYPLFRTTNFRFDFGVLNNNEINDLGAYPKNKIATISTTLVDVEQTQLKAGDWVRITANFNFDVNKVKIYDESLVFFNNKETEIITTGDIFTLYLQVKHIGNINNVSLSIQGYNEHFKIWGSSLSTNEYSDNINMSNVVNINNNNPIINSIIYNSTLQKQALDVLEGGNITYNLGQQSFWVYNTLNALNTDFNLNVIDINKILGVILKTTSTYYNLNKQFTTQFINANNGKIIASNVTIPVASINHTATFDIKNLPSSTTHTLLATFNQIINTNRIINASIVSVNSPTIIPTNFEYVGNDKIRVRVMIPDNQIRGTLTLRLSNVENLAGRLLTFNGNYTIRGFLTRDLTGVLGQNFIPLSVEIMDEVGFNSILLNNGSPMNYKNWNNGAVLTSDAMAKTTGLSSGDQYAYTFDPINKRIILSQYILATLLNNAPQIRIFKT